MVGVRQLERTDPDLWTSAARQWEQVAQAADRVRADVSRNAAGWGAAESKAEWSGQAAGAARNRVGTLVDHLGGTTLELQAVAMVLRGAGHAFEIARTTLRNALRQAEAHGLTVADDGTVSAHASAADHKDPASMSAINAQAAQVRELVAIALREADQADMKVAQELGKLAHTEGIPGYSQARGTGQQADLQQASDLEVRLLMDSVPNGGDDPAAVAAWWNGLTPAERQALALAAPTRLAGLAGIPDAVRRQLTTSATNGPDGRPVNPAGIVDYAYQHWNSPQQYPQDCTDFTSKALNSGGGMPQDDRWHQGLLRDTRSWTLGSGLQGYLDSDHRSDPVDRSGVRPGDVVYWVDGHGKADHAAVVTAVVDGRVKYAAHSNGLVNGDLDMRTAGFNDDDGNPMTVHFRRPRGSAPPGFRGAPRF
jgi:hypothetical protein